MNVLYFVFSMLMVLSILTYGRLESFRSFAGMQAEFVRFMETEERQWINEQAVKLYDKTTASESEKKELQHENTLNSTSKISVKIFSDTTLKPTVIQHYHTVLKNLMTFLYADKPFLKEAFEQRPALLDELLQAIQQSSQEKKIYRPKQLASLDLNDPLLNEIFYKMLKGSLKHSEDRNENYLSLLDFLTNKNKFKLRIYLAPRPILSSLFDPATTEEISQERNRLYREVITNRMKPEEAASIFQSQFANRQRPEISDQILDFTVSKTRPSTK